MVIFCPGEEVTERDLPPEIQIGNGAATISTSPASTPLGEDSGGTVSLDELGHRAILRALRKAGGDKTRTAQRLGIGLRTLHRKLNECRIQEERDIKERNEP
jgi:DNA-binding NtrC family response regulator